MIEQLERRLALHAAHAVLLADGTLEIEGTGQKDVIDIARASSRLVVAFRFYGPQSFDYKSVRRISVATLGGNDIVQVSNGVTRAIRMDGGDGDDHMQGGGGRDKIVGGAGRDTLIGQDGNDVLRGDDDNDRLRGGAGDDKLVGGAGNDVLKGQAGRDRMIGGAGKDTVLADDKDADILDRGADVDRGTMDRKIC